MATLLTTQANKPVIIVVGRTWIDGQSAVWLDLRDEIPRSRNFARRPWACTNGHLALGPNASLSRAQADENLHRVCNLSLVTLCENYIILFVRETQGAQLWWPTWTCRARLR